MTKKPIVIFDLDGTLVNSAPDLLDSLNYCLDVTGYKKISPDFLHHLVGQGGRIMIERALTMQNIKSEPQHIDRLVKLFLQHYNQNIPGKTRYFPDVVAMLDSLEQAGYLLAVCTNKYGHPARSLLHAIDRPDRYAAICGGDSFSWHKPDPRHITGTIDKANGDAARAVMVGDSSADIHAAKAANIPVIAVDFGYTDIPVEQLEPTMTISSFAELTPQIIAAMIKNKLG